MQIKEAEQQLLYLHAKYVAEEEAIIDKLSKEEREAIGRPLKTVNTLDEFHANGTKYIVHKSLAITRFEQFEILQTQVGYGLDFRNMFDNLKSAYAYLNEGQQADAAVVLYNMMNGIKNNLDGRENEVLALCSLYIAREGEDLTTIDEALMRAKIADWREEGIAVESFFELAFNLVNGFMPLLNQTSESISEMVKNGLKA